MHHVLDWSCSHEFANFSLTQSLAYITGLAKKAFQ